MAYNFDKRDSYEGPSLTEQIVEGIPHAIEIVLWGSICVGLCTAIGVVWVGKQICKSFKRL